MSYVVPIVLVPYSALLESMLVVNQVQTNGANDVYITIETLNCLISSCTLARKLPDVRHGVPTRVSAVCRSVPSLVLASQHLKPLEPRRDDRLFSLLTILH